MHRFEDLYRRTKEILGTKGMVNKDQQFDAVEWINNAECIMWGDKNKTKKKTQQNTTETKKKVCYQNCHPVW